MIDVSLLLSILLFLVLLSVVVATWSFAPWVPTRRRALERVFKIAQLQKGDRFVDLGSEDGRVVFATSAKGARSKGVELALPLYLWSRFLSPFMKGESRFVRGNLFNHSLADADVVFIYGMPYDRVWDRLRPKLEKELRPGSRVVTMVFPVKGWSPDIVDKPEKEDPIYLYRR